MKQYCVYKSKGLSRLIPYLIVLQHDGFRRLDDVIAAPVVKEDKIRGIPIINPRIEIDGETYFVQVDKLSVLNKRNFGDYAADFDQKHDAFIRAIDRLFSGI